jgi:cyclase
VAAAVLLLVATGCDFSVQPLGGAEGRTQVYVAAGRAGVPNAGIVCTSVGCVVIDPMLSPTVSELLRTQAEAKSRIFWDNIHAQRKERAKTLAPPVLYVLNTTYRGSHSFGNQSFPMADVVATPRAKDRYIADARTMREELRDKWNVPGLEGFAATPATLTVDGTLTLDTPEVKIQFVSMGDCAGEGDAVVYLPIQKVLFAGDLVLCGYVPYHKGRTLTVRRWIEALKTLEKWEIETVVPGHGDLARKDALAKQRQFLEALVTQTEEAIKAGKSADDAAKSVKLPEFASWARYEEWLPENVKLVYRELKEGPGKADAKADATGPGLVEPKVVVRPDAFRDK